MITKGKVDLNAAGITGNTPLMWAAYAGQLEVVKMMIRDYGADPKRKNNEGETALMIAANQGHRNVTRFLEEYE